jgi:small-conductance mechanosensitive channel
LARSTLPPVVRSYLFFSYLAFRPNNLHSFDDFEAFVARIGSRLVFDLKTSEKKSQLQSKRRKAKLKRFISLFVVECLIICLAWFLFGGVVVVIEGSFLLLVLLLLLLAGRPDSRFKSSHTFIFSASFFVVCVGVIVVVLIYLRFLPFPLLSVCLSGCLVPIVVLHLLH